MRRSWFNGCNMRSLAPRIEIGGMDAPSSMESSQQGNGAGALGIRARYARTACNLEHPEWRSPRGAFSDPMDDEGPGGGIRPIPAAGFDADAKASAAGLQSNAATPSAQVETPSPAISDSLRPALEQVGHSVSQIQIDHWKVSKSWKEQLQSDADSITGDLSHQLPGLLQQAQATPAALDAQLRVMQNVDALYDVLVRLTLAADLTEKKSDAALLDSALERLESARKAATAQLVTAAAQQHQQLSDLQARMEAIQASHPVSATHGKTIVVDNEVRHERPHHTTHHKKPSPSTKSQPNTAPSTGDKPSPQ